MTPLDFAALALATWRLAYMIAREDGPFEILKRTRVRFPLGGLLTCVFCASVWSAVVLWLILQTPLYPLVYMLAASGLAVWGHQYIGFD